MKKSDKTDNKNFHLNNEKLRKNINVWLVWAFLIAAILLAPNFKAAQIFLSLSMIIIGSNIVLLVTLAIKDFKIKLTASNNKMFNYIKKEIKKSIKKEQLIKFSKIDDKIDEYNFREDLYSHLVRRKNFDLIKNILKSVFLAVFYIIFYAVFSNLINVQISALGNLLIINMILIVLFFTALYLFLASIVYVAISLLE